VFSAWSNNDRFLSMHKLWTMACAIARAGKNKNTRCPRVSWGSSQTSKDSSQHGPPKKLQDLGPSKKLNAFSLTLGRYLKGPQYETQRVQFDTWALLEWAPVKKWTRSVWHLGPTWKGPSMKLNTFSLTLGHIRWSLGNQQNMDRFFCPMSINFIEKPPDLGITKVAQSHF